MDYMLKIVDIIGNGTIYGGTGASDNTAIRASLGSTINIYSGTFYTGVEPEYSGETTLYCTDSSVINIFGGTFYTETSYNNIYFVLNPQVESQCQFNVYGGTFINYNPANNYTKQNFVQDGYKVVTSKNGNDTYYTVKKA